MKTSFLLTIFPLLLTVPVAASDQTPVLVIGAAGTSTGLKEGRNEDQAVARFTKLGYPARGISIQALDQNWLKKYPVLFLSTGWAQQVDDFRRFESKAPLFEEFVKKGGGLIVGQPNPYHHPGKTVTVNFLPSPITFYCMYQEADAQRINLTHKHYLTEDLRPDELPFPHDQMQKLDRQKWQVLAMGARTESPSLVVAEWGKGRVVVLTGAENAGANNPVGDKILKRIVTWAAGREPQRFRKKPPGLHKKPAAGALSRLQQALGNSEEYKLYGPGISVDPTWRRCSSDPDCVRVLSPCGMQHVIVNRKYKKRATDRWKKACGNKTPPAAIGRAPRPGCRKGRCVDLGSL